MAEIFSTVAGAVGLVDVILRTTIGYKTVASELVNSSDEASRARDTIINLRRVLISVKQFIEPLSEIRECDPEVTSNVSRIESILKDIHRDVEELEIFIRVAKKTSSVERAKQRLSVVFKKEKFTETLSRIESHKSDLSLHIQLLSSLSSRNPSLANQRRAQRADDGNTVELSQTAIDIQTGQRDLQNEQRAGFDALRQSTTSLLNEQTQLGDQVSEIARGMKSLQLALMKDRTLPKTHVSGSAVDTSLVVSAVYTFLKGMLPNQISGEGVTGDEDVTAWLQRELDELLADIQEQSAEELRQRTNSNRPLSHETSRISRYGDSEELHSSVAVKGMHYTKSLAWLSRNAVTAKVDILTPLGQAVFLIARDYRSSAITGARLSFVPNDQVSPVLKGFNATFGNAYRQRTEPSRAISTFGTHPLVSPIYESIYFGDIESVRRMLSLRQVHPNDRIHSGVSLLGCAIFTGQFEIFKLLVREGANPQNISEEGTSGPLYYLGSLSDRLKANHKYQVPEDFEENLTYLVKFHGDEFAGFEYSILYNGQKLTHAISMTEVAFIRFKGLKNYRVFLLKLLMSLHHDPNEKNAIGDPLLDTAINVTIKDTYKMQKTLLQHGATLQPLFDGQETPLSLCLYRLSACGLGVIETGQISDVMEIVVTYINMRDELCSNMKYRRSPSANALSPVAWTVWCTALDQTGINLEEILRKEDRLNDLKFSRKFLQRKYEKIINFAAPKWIVEDPQAYNEEELSSYTMPAACERCGRHELKTVLRPPFDLFVQQLNSLRHRSSGETRPAHIFRQTHQDGSLCDNYMIGGMCHHPWHDGHNLRHPQQDIRGCGWRKHVAHRLWREGVLTTPQQAYTWASGLSPDWEDLFYYGVSDDEANEDERQRRKDRLDELKKAHEQLAKISTKTKRRKWPFGKKRPVSMKKSSN